MADSPRKQLKAAREAAKAAKEAKDKAKADLIRNVKAAANAAGIENKYVHIISTKTAGEIIATAKRKKNASIKKAAKVAQGETRKAANIIKSLVRQVKEQAPDLSNSAIGKITSKMAIANIIAKARKRMSTKGKKAVRNTSRASLKRRLKEAGIASANIKFTKNATNYNTLLAAAQKRVTAKQAKLHRMTAQQALEQAAREAGVDPKFVKLKKDETLSAAVRMAKKRFNATAKKDRRTLVKAAILDGLNGSDITEADIKSAFCTRAK